MSGRLMAVVWQSRLPHRLKNVAVAMAWYGADDGTSIRPLLTTLAKRVSLSERRTQAALSDLQELGVLTITRRCGPYRPTEYQLNLPALEQLPPPRSSMDVSFTVHSPRFPQGFPQAPSNNGRTFEFSTVSTGVHRTLPSGVHRTLPSGRSVQEIKRSSTSTARARKNHNQKRKAQR